MHAARSGALMLVSAIMPTRERPGMAARALACWRAQDWPDKELVVVDDRDAPSFPSGIDEPGVVYHVLDQRLTVGAKRNIACELASGEVIIHFDSDDFSAPGRIRDQVERMIALDKSVSAYSGMTFTDGKNYWLYPEVKDLALGTSLCFKKSWWLAHKFKDMQVGQDECFGHQAAYANQLITVPAGNMMIATNHPQNTSPRSTDRGPWRKIPDPGIAHNLVL